MRLIELCALDSKNLSLIKHFHYFKIKYYNVFYNFIRITKYTIETLHTIYRNSFIFKYFLFNFLNKN